MSPAKSVPPLYLVADVTGVYAAIVAEALARRDGEQLRFAASGGTTGRACMEALVRHGLAWNRVDLFFVDERCVPFDSPDSNARSLAEVLGDNRDKLAGFHPMDCEKGAQAYEDEIRAIGGFDVIQLGMGPDGHTASLFPGSPALAAPADQLVATNHDPSGNNAHDRLTLTYGGIALSELVVVTVAGAEKHEILTRLAAGEELPISRVSAKQVVFLVDPAAAGDLPTAELPPELLGPAAGRT